MSQEIQSQSQLMDWEPEAKPTPASEALKVTELLALVELTRKFRAITEVACPLPKKVQQRFIHSI